MPTLPARPYWNAMTWTERAACTLGSAVAQGRLVRGVATRYQGGIVVPVLGKTVDDRLHTHGMDHLPDGQSFIIAANHRSYFDLYAVLLAVWHHFPKARHLYCPVRTTFFYERPLGIALNLAVCGHAMYPPVFRDSRSGTLNQLAVELAVDVLRDDPRAILAIHPEGRRNTNPDPYQYLPAKAGVGRIALQAQRPIVPVYVGGLPPTFGELVRERASGRGTPVRVRVGAPLDLSGLYDRAADPAAHREATDQAMADIAALGEADRAFMAERFPGR